MSSNKLGSPEPTMWVAAHGSVSFFRSLPTLVRTFGPLYTWPTGCHFPREGIVIRGTRADLVYWINQPECNNR